MTGKRQRLDVLLHDLGYFESRERSKAAVMAGLVKVNGQVTDKPGTNVQADDLFEITGGQRYVSRGGLKLEKALNSFNIDLHDKVVLDVGASTGGFTDCALQNGAARVFAVDVGYGQLAWKLRSDTRVTVIERTNIRALLPIALDIVPDFATIDVSFISLNKVLPEVYRLVDRCSRGVALIKPQFEAGRDKVGKKGVIKNPDVHRSVLINICNMMSENKWGVIGLDFSPVKGPQGNIEYLMFFDFLTQCEINIGLINNVVEMAHASLLNSKQDTTF